MRLTFFPSYEEVFAEDTLRGIFYPVCKVVDERYPCPLYIVSSNGLFFDEQYITDQNSHIYTLFDIVDGQYVFNGDIRLYKGYEVIQEVFLILQEDFVKNKEKYSSLLRTSIHDKAYDLYVEALLPQVAHLALSFNFAYYAKTFLLYHLSKERYKEEGVHTTYRAGKEIVLDNIDMQGSYGDIEINAEYIFPESMHFESFEFVGSIYGDDFFAESNDVSLLYQKDTYKVLIVNSCS